MLKRVVMFKYLGQIPLSVYSDWPVVTGNLHKARWKWDGSSHMLVREGKDPRMYRRFYIAVVQSILIFRGRDMVGNDPHP